MGMDYSDIVEASDFIKNEIEVHAGSLPTIGLVLGSGLGSVAASIESPVIIPYSTVPHMRTSTAPTHAGGFVIGRLSGHTVICMQGRIHLYEGYSAQEVTFPIYVMKLLGVEQLLITNASGGINREFAPGDLMLIDDQINFTGTNPLVGPVIEKMGVRFNGMENAYSPRLLAIAHDTAAELGIQLHHGVYIGDLGPSFETPAEIVAFRKWGADAVGMSTVLEVIVAANIGIETMGISLVTNMAAGVLEEPIDMDHVAEVGMRSAGELGRLITGILEHI